jgi:hypothetical protein
MAGQEAIWHVIIDDKEEGPLSKAQVLEYLRDGMLAGSDLIWRPGFPGWKSVSEISDFWQAPKRPSIRPSIQSTPGHVHEHRTVAPAAGFFMGSRVFFRLIKRFTALLHHITPFPHIGETDCVAGVVGFELRCAERKFISLRCRVSSDSGAPAETAAVPRENDLLRWGWTVSSPPVAVSPTLRNARRAVAPHHIKVRILSPRQVGYELRWEGVDSAASSCTSVQCLRRSNQPEDCSLSARLPVQTERQWWATEPLC